MDNILEKYPFTLASQVMNEELEQVISRSSNEKCTSDKLKLLFSCIDLTSLNTEDSAGTISDFVEKVNQFGNYFPLMPTVAALCVYPVFAPALKSSLRVNGIKKAVVSAGFPSSQTFVDVKKMETRRAIDFGANEIDIVISVGEFLDGNYEFVGEEIRMIKDVMGDVHLKVILESGALKEPEEVWKASILAMENGADFIKTSTGKQQPAATPLAAYIMLKAIKAYHKATGKKIGFKPAGGISTTTDALVYYNLVELILGNDWLNNELFRIGASRLANNLLTDINSLETGVFKEIKYF